MQIKGRRKELWQISLPDLMSPLMLARSSLGTSYLLPLGLSFPNSKMIPWMHSVLKTNRMSACNSGLHLYQLLIHTKETWLRISGHLNHPPEDPPYGLPASRADRGSRSSGFSGQSHWREKREGGEEKGEKNPCSICLSCYKSFFHLCNTQIPGKKTEAQTSHQQLQVMEPSPI